MTLNYNIFSKVLIKLKNLIIYIIFTKHLFLKVSKILNYHKIYINKTSLKYSFKKFSLNFFFFNIINNNH
jgi:hypothetical protein